MDTYEKIKKVLALGFMNFLDENKPKDKMCLSNGECADIEKAFNEQDWPKLARYLDKYTESEDERIRKSIVATIEQCPGDFLNPKNRDKMLSYLEKQKEPKYAPDDLQKSFEAGQASIVDNPEQYGLCKKAEWSEEDEEMIKMILGDLEWERRNTIVDKDIRHYDEEIAWLKSLRPSWKPSEEQMKTLNWAANGMMDQCIAAPEMRAVLRELYDDLLKLK